MRKQASGFYADSLEMLLDTMCNVLGAVVFIALMVTLLIQDTPPPDRQYFESQATELTNELAAITASNAMLEAELQLTLRRLQDPQQRFQTNAVSLPSLRPRTRPAWNVIVRDGRLYPTHFLAPNTREGKTRNERTLEWRRRVTGRLYVEPRWGQGDEPTSGIEEMVRAFRQASRTNFYFAFYVYDDSFAAFNRAKETATLLGFQYGWKPIPQNLPLEQTDRGEGVPPQN